ncbi:MAG: sulfite exporter TauE/SafE family protein, partial [Acidobacteriota bacterium]
MCGPVVVSFSLSLSHRTASQQISAHLAYNVGRVITYSLLGAVAGLTGQVFDLAGKLAGIENIVAIVAGVLMIVAGLLMLDLLPHRFLQRFA